MGLRKLCIEGGTWRYISIILLGARSFANSMSVVRTDYGLRFESAFLPP